MNVGKDNLIGFRVPRRPNSPHPHPFRAENIGDKRISDHDGVPGFDPGVFQRGLENLPARFSESDRGRDIDRRKKIAEPMRLELRQDILNRAGVRNQPERMPLLAKLPEKLGYAVDKIPVGLRIRVESLDRGMNILRW